MTEADAALVPTDEPAGAQEAATFTGVNEAINLDLILANTHIW